MTDTLEKKKSFVLESDTSTVSSSTLSSNNTKSQDISSVPSSSSSESSNGSLIVKDLEKEFNKINCNDENFYTNECNNFLLKREILESNFLSQHPESEPYLYPNLSDTNFNVKIASKKEFNDTKYDGTIHDSIKEQADLLANADFELQPHQAFVKNFMSFQTPYSSLLLYHGLGSGKCHSKGTPIMMFDGTIKLIENITVGDLLMGDDSTPRTVLSLARGKDKMYDVIPIKGDKYTVNQEHILCLRKSSVSNIIEISIKDYLKLSEPDKEILKGYKVPVEFPEKDLPVDPYLVGINFYSQHKNKNIPLNYKCNSRVNRLKLLAGLLDSRTNLSNDNSLDFEDNCDMLINDVIYLVRSLGFACYKSVNQIDCNYVRIHISGEGIETIPTVKHKIVVEPTKDALLTGIKVEYVNEDEYYGFTLSGNCRYIMGDFTVTHNTCSAIGVCEEMRDYMKQMGITKRIIIVASENVQDNFKLQLFDERKLKQVDGIWNVRACTGNKLLKEINPMNMKGLSKEKVVSQIKNLINSYYIFLGYGQFANYIIKTLNYTDEVERSKTIDKRKPGEKNKIQSLKDLKITLNKRIIQRLRNEFNNRLIVIDEVHNIRKTDDNENKKVAMYLEMLVKSAENLRFLLLSATPMYNSYKEIVWLLNLMNTNDRRSRIEAKDIFDKNGDFKKNGEELLIRKATGYISFVRGENPYTFPYRVYPSEFAKEHTFPAIKYPSYQMNLKKIPHEDKKRILSLYLNKIGNCGNCGKCQYCCYKYIIYNLRNKKFSVTTKKGVVRDMPSFENMESFGYTLLQTPLESLIISYPVPGLKSILDEIPSEHFSEELSENFSELTFEDENEESEESEENEESESEKEVLPLKQIKAKSIIIENSSESVNDNNSFDNGIVTKASSVTKTLADSVKSFVPSVTKTLADSAKSFVPSVTKTLADSTKTLVDSANTLVPSVMTKKGGVTSSSKIDNSMSIDPHQLTGKAGLERMMNYVDEKSPPQKGEFEYKKSTIDNYGRIFSQEIIGKYSVKIKSILDNILNPKNQKVGEGIILIYSQYIDSGLIPMALALEEMGFTRYGENVKPLFKNRPSDVVDARTMKSPEDKKNYMPARYSMITGDPRLSPNNDFEVKGLTNENNKEGHKIKVVLISKAGSEGIDLKFIRQVHILEPWYNMNRPEQIIGRAVRNFSHKDLPFEKRNVEIFMYGTILDDNNEEAADLYVYRVAEYKAVQIGNVSRVLKESAVDCIINHDQTNFTQEIMSANLKEPITQELSSGLILNEFKVGDAPFSPACDYMATCNYSCRPDKKIDENNLNEDTYSENFIMMNSEKILQRIRMLMKESYFYKKDVLLKLIRTPKEYPYIQIYSALTQLIEDNSEFITDKYGRNGRLINIGEYYLFQPLELKDHNVSMFDRSVPIDYKHDMINFEIKKNMVTPVLDSRNIGNIIVEEEIHTTEGKRILDEMKVNFDICHNFTKQNKVPRGDDNWYKHCGIVMKKMSIEFPESSKYLIEFLVSHLIELLLYEEKLELMNYLYFLDNINNGSFEWFAKEYFEKRIIKTKTLSAIILYKLNKRMIMILNNKNKWIESEPEDQKELANSKEAKQMLTFNEEDFNTIIGFIGYEKKNKYLVFKTKDIKSKRDTGARCDEAGKEKTLKKINEIIGENKYSSESTKLQKDVDGNIIKEAVGTVELCVLQEFILRYFDTIKKNNKKWFLTPEMAIYYKLYTVNN